MPFLAFRAHVVSTQRISPSFQRIRLGGLEDMGPAGPTRDLRIKLIFPGSQGLPALPEGDANWFDHWRSLDPAARGPMRTYSVRNHVGSEIDVDFVLHTAPGATGPACAWAQAARPGDEILVIAPPLSDASGGGIEFSPGSASQIHLFGDETALPAIARIIDEWPSTPVGLTGTAHIEVPYAQDQQILAAPNGVDVRYYARGTRPHGEALLTAAAQLLKTEVPEYSPTGMSPEETVWETPVFSASGEPLDASSDAHTASPAPDAYFWIAGESTLVTTMRRMLVKQVGVPREQVSFMGYWKRGRAEN
ncbi:MULTISPECIES: siderophore-interacting protein [Corynebacterium]|uniref:Siderophore-interacting protein n=1 Tax=Corynebacterium phoceense TaxID=1686286 RepID=A0A540R8T0_9CORY|nr:MULTISPECIES: siderophore-interacting protein [Corynebacterium]KXB56473.1 Siderophore-interacting FAD-binding domain protein [Corynebacterium sp. DNF00584]MBF9011853.1 siderophore-interacting protein [Corynebacterium phoceense]OFL79844.1 hypothetical protein HMPREF2748_08760 [Corynebacterium sp. HMSC077B05]OFN44838.1 hypothetical protein HMPREF2559_07805 [Corynebacterium sp. HMSC072G08]OFP17817.1 hypothetical protein HMPREF2998_01850 [Corynebacterium sp. HMSC065A05]